jgi:hypothetical protein
MDRRRFLGTVPLSAALALPSLEAGGLHPRASETAPTTKLTEPLELQFRAEAFNLWNRVQFAAPGSAYGATTVGVVSSQQNQPHCEQFALRLNFWLETTCKQNVPAGGLRRPRGAFPVRTPNLNVQASGLTAGSYHGL